MQLKSTVAIYRDARSAGASPPGADEEVERYLRETTVILRNKGTQPFSGIAATFDGVEYSLEPGQAKQVALRVAVYFLGNYSLSGEKRAKEYERLRTKYSGFEVIDKRDLERHGEALDAFGRIKDIGSYSKDDIQAAREALIRPLPVPGPIPQLEVLDIETSNPLPVSWPLYDPEFVVEEREPLPQGVQTEIDRLREEIDELRKERAEQSLGEILESDE